MEKVKNLADELAKLRLIVHVPNFTDPLRPHLLRFRCVTCDSGAAPFTFEKVATERIDGIWKNSQLEGIVRPGRYPLIDLDQGRCAVVLPFDLRKWQSHLLHDVRAVWDMEFICARGSHVQEWPDREGARTIELQ